MLDLVTTRNRATFKSVHPELPLVQQTKQPSVLLKQVGMAVIAAQKIHKEERNRSEVRSKQRRIVA
jgi:hypothetical protein